MQLRKAKQVRLFPSPAKSSVNSATGPAIILAAMSLLSIKPAIAEIAPERGLMSLRYLDYQDSQPGENRIHVGATSAMVMVPMASEWSVAGTYTTDSISGASPRYYTYDSNCKVPQMHDLRRAEDVTLTRYFSQGTASMGASYSKESDYISQGFSAQGTLSTEDKNTTLNFGTAVSNDEINPVNKIVIGERKHVLDMLAGVTQVFTPQDIAQFNLGHAMGVGYFSDPYKIFDNRPRSRNETTALLRWNHFFYATEGTSHLSYRYYSDTYDIRAHTIDAAYDQPTGSGWMLSPEVRFYSQSAAWFYLEPDPSARPFPTFPSYGSTYYSLDQRLSSFGAITLGLRVSKKIGNDWLADIKYEQYEQRTNWSVMGNSVGLDPFRARSIQFGLSCLF